MQSMEQPLLDRSELAKRLKVSSRTIIKLETMGLPVINVTGFVRYEWPEVLQWLKDNSQSTQLRRPIEAE